VPIGVLVSVEMVKVEVVSPPEVSAILAGAAVIMGRSGTTGTQVRQVDRLTAPEKLFRLVIVIVDDVEAPCETVNSAGVAAMLKSSGDAFTKTWRVQESDMVSLVA
jgi:hypothetical protein